MVKRLSERDKHNRVSLWTVKIQSGDTLRD